MMYMNHHEIPATLSAAALYQQNQQRSSSVNSSSSSTSSSSSSSSATSPPSLSPPQTSAAKCLNLAALAPPAPTNYVHLPYYYPTASTNTTTFSSPFSTSALRGAATTAYPTTGSILGSTFLTALDPNSTGYKTFGDTNFLLNKPNTLFTSTTTANNTAATTLLTSPYNNDTYKHLSQLYLLNQQPTKTVSTSTSTTTNPSTTSILSSPNISTNGLTASSLSSLSFANRSATFAATKSILANSSTIPIPFSSFLVDLKSGGIGIKRPKKRFKKPIELRRVLPKNSLMLLHELRPNVEYRFVSQSGPIHRPLFTMCVDINEHKFEGIGKTKKLARMEAAQKAVDFLIKNPEYIQKPSKPASSSSSSTGGETSSTTSATTSQLAAGLDDEDDDDDDEDETNETSSEAASDESEAKKLKVDDALV